MPGWDGFKLQVKSVMESYPLDSDILAKQLAVSYDIAMKTPPAGDLIVGNPVLTGNVAGMEAVFKSVFLQQAVSPQQLPLIQLLSLGFITYWTGATIAPLKIPAIAPIGATPPSLQNLSGLCTFPGTTAQIPPFVYKGEVSVDSFINNFITAADIHLRTVSGIYNVMALYGVPPTATTAPGIVNWLGFTTNANSVITSNQLAFDSAFLALGLGDRPDLLGNADGIVAAYNASVAGDETSGGEGDLSISKRPITDDPLTFIEAAIQIIATVEGGYGNPAMVVDHPYNNPNHKHYRPSTRTPFIKDKRYHKSGETMFGLDRIAGNLESTADGRAFFALIDAQNAYDNWSYNYIPPDPLKSQLVLLAAKIMKPNFDRNMNNYVKNPQLRALVPTNGKLMWNFAYATWNGPGWFKAFGQRVNEVYEKGMKDPKDLAEYFTNLRINNENLIGNKKGGDAYSLIRQGGFKIASKLGITPITTTELWAAQVNSKLSGTISA
jgi:hypothetical protein